MHKPDVIVCWPRGCDYPRWREWIRSHRERFREVYAVLTEHAGPEYSDFLRQQPGITWLDSPDRTGRDWRDVAVNHALDHSRAEYVWFTEQDFVVTDSEFWNELHGPLVGIDAFDGRPLHPACLFVSRALLDGTCRYFGTDPGDHFYSVGRDLVQKVEPRYIATGWRHYQAISESQLLLGLGQRPRFRPQQFTEWLTDQLSADVPLDPRWRGMAEAEIARSGHGWGGVHR